MKISPILTCAVFILYFPGCASQAIERSNQYKTQQFNSTPLTMAQLYEGFSAEPPRPIKVYPPHIPTEALKGGLSGIVILTLTVNEKGTVTNVEIKSTTNPIFNKACLNAVKRYKIKPAKKNGKPVSVVFDLSISIDK